MGQAKQRGTFEQRRTQAFEAGHIKAAKPYFVKPAFKPFPTLLPAKESSLVSSSPAEPFHALSEPLVAPTPALPTTPGTVTS